MTIQFFITGLVSVCFALPVVPYMGWLFFFGIQVSVEDGFSRWRFNASKAAIWIEEFEQAIRDNRLTPATASRFCGRIAFLNSTVCNRLGRALIRPLIWRQVQRFGPVCLTNRLRHSLTWFIAALKANVGLKVPLYVPVWKDRVILYSDAEGNGGVAAVAVFNDHGVFMRGKIPNSVRSMLVRRRTNIVAFELLIAVAALVSFCPEMLVGKHIDHYIDSQPALSCLLKGASSKPDLSNVAGRLWFECCHLMSAYRASYVQSKHNLADGPSRNDVALMYTLGFSEIPFCFPSFSGGLDSWMRCPWEANRMMV